MTTFAPEVAAAVPSQSDTVTVSDLTSATKRIWKPFLIGSVLGAVLGVVILLLQPTWYSSYVRVWVRDAPVSLDAGFENQRTFSIDTEAARVDSAEVVERSGITVGPDQSVKAVTVTAPVNSKILQIRVTADSPSGAQEAAGAIGAAFLAARQDFLTTRRDDTVERLDAEAERVGAQISRAPNDQARDLWRVTLDSVITTREQARAARTNPGSVITAATVPVTVSKNPTVLPASLAILGGMVALIGTLWRQHRTPARPPQPQKEDQ